MLRELAHLVRRPHSFLTLVRQRKRVPIVRALRRLRLEELEERIAPAVYGLDVSNNQGTIDWSQVATNVPQQAFAIIKAAQGTSSNSAFANNAPAATTAGLIVGAYDFADPAADVVPSDSASVSADALAEAQAYANVLIANNYFAAIHLQPALDLEDDTQGAGFQTNSSASDYFTWAQKATWVNDWLADFAQDFPGTTPILYMNQNWAQNLGAADPALAIANPLWVAAPNNNPSFTPNIAPWTNYAIMQWSWTGNLVGINSQVDLDVLNSSTMLMPWRSPRPWIRSCNNARRWPVRLRRS